MFQASNQNIECAMNMKQFRNWTSDIVEKDNDKQAKVAGAHIRVLLLSFEYRSTTSIQASGALDMGLPKQSCKEGRIAPLNK